MVELEEPSEVPRIAPTIASVLGKYGVEDVVVSGSNRSPAIAADPIVRALENKGDIQLERGTECSIARGRCHVRTCARGVRAPAAPLGRPAAEGLDGRRRPTAGENAG
jgi:hypothetical protein